MYKISIHSIARPKNLFTFECKEVTIGEQRITFTPDISSEEMRQVDIVRLTTIGTLSLKLQGKSIDVVIDDKEYDRLSVYAKR
jgi:hypothetical protein